MRRWLLPSCLLLAAAVVALLVSQEVFVSFDRYAFSTWHSSGAWQHLLVPFSIPGAIVVLVGLGCFVPKLRSLRAAVVIGATFCALEVVELLMKIFFVQPAGSLPQPVLGLRILYSFPSGHTMRAAFIFCLVGVLVPKRFWGVLVAALGFVAWGLVASGAHYPSDVLGGLLLGSAAGIGVGRLLLGSGSREG